MIMMTICSARECREPARVESDHHSSLAPVEKGAILHDPYSNGEKFTISIWPPYHTTLQHTAINFGSQIGELFTLG